MTAFRTVVPLERSYWSMDHQSKITLLGSCFSDHIGKKLKGDGLDAIVNPFGTLFNPYAIFNLMDRAWELRYFQASDFFEKDGLWQSFALNRSFVDNDLEALVKKANQQLDLLRDRLIKGDYLIITWGTAWVYREKTSGDWVANCHKVPASAFEKQRLEVAQVVTWFREKMKVIHSKNPTLKVVLTVSPVRHWKDGAIENNQSKSVLLLAASQVTDKLVSYFPSYEIVMDDLRDYRFFESDMLHPNQVAVDYIYGGFQRTFFDENTIALAKEVRNIKKDEIHRSLNPNSKAHLKFTKNLESKRAQLWSRHQYLKARW